MALHGPCDNAIASCLWPEPPVRHVKLPFGTAWPPEQNDGEEVVQDVELAGSASWSTTPRFKPPRVKRSINLSCTRNRASPLARQTAAVATPGRDSGLAAGVAADEPLLRLKATVVSAAPWLGLGLVTKSTSCHNSPIVCSKFVAF